MPISVFINTFSIIIGGIVGASVGNRLDPDFKKNINMLFGACTMGMGICTIVLMENMPAVILALIIGTALGLKLQLGKRINSAAGRMQKTAARMIKTSSANMPYDEFMSTLVTVIVLFCASGTGIYGSIVAGMTGDHSILLAKSILDLFAAMLFACSLGLVTSLIAVPHLIFFLSLFFCAKLIFPLTTPSMINDFKAVGGFITFASGFRVVKLKMFPVADMLPAIILVFPFSWFWTAYILPLVS